MIVIPMAGLSSRFLKAGYEKPKYMLVAHGESLFSHAVNSFKQYFDSEYFLFITRDIQGTENFVNVECQRLKIKNYCVVVLPKETMGQADTVRQGVLENADKSEALTIFNIDTFRPGFVFPDFIDECDGYLEVFNGTGNNWSFIRVDSVDKTKVIQTTEKNAISNFCCTGLYHFKNISSFLNAYDTELRDNLENLCNGEVYVAPLYNHLIQRGLYIRYNLIDESEVIFCGIPNEYEGFLKNAGNL